LATRLNRIYVNNLDVKGQKMAKTEKKDNKEKIVKLEAEMGRLFEQKEMCQQTIQQINPKLNQVILKLQKLRQE
jgi:hypothetical protein